MSEATILCEADTLLLRSLVADYQATIVTIELLRARVEGLITAASLIAELGTKGRDLLVRAQRVTCGMVAAREAKATLEVESQAAEVLDTLYMSAWRRALREAAEVRDEMIALCFTDETQVPQRDGLAHGRLSAVK